MIVLEGPDGGGKTSLLDRLLEDFPALAPGPRASSSEGGPVADLKGWVDNDLESWTQPSHTRIYDRYPLISEPIYGPICRDGLPKDWNGGWMRARTRLFRKMAFVIFCLPPISTVRTNVLGGAAQMAGVTSNINAVWHAYNHISATYAGRCLYWDYQRPDKPELYARVYDHIRSWNG